MDPDHQRHGGSSLGEATLDIKLGSVASAAPQPDEPFAIGILGDFRGHREAAGNDGPPLAHRQPKLVDRDNFNAVLAHFAPEVRISLTEDGPEVTVRFSELEDFHPDRLYERLPLFRSLRETRHRLSNPATFRDAARELWGRAERPVVADPPPEPAPRPFAAGNLLDQILGDSPDAAAAPARRGDDLADYIRRIVAPHAVANPDPRQPDALAQIDAVIGSQMRALLHHPAFQALEALWRSVFFLVRRAETGTTLRIYLIDLTRAELEAQLATDREVQDTDLGRLLVESAAGTMGGVSWALLIGNYTFGALSEEMQQLRRLGRLAQRAGGPWIAAADPRLVGCPSFGTNPDPDNWTLPTSSEWEELRHAPEAAHLGLVLPRFLVRLPYGEDSDPCEQFQFEEFDQQADHEEYLWGNSAIACGLLIAQAFAAEGWSLRPGTHRDIGNLPLHLRSEHGAVTAKPCAEAWMSERAAARILESGVMALASLKNQDSVLLVRCQSIASPAAPLAGRWALASRG